MKTRKILAASTAALLAFGTTAAYVASASSSSTAVKLSAVSTAYAEDYDVAADKAVGAQIKSATVSGTDVTIEFKKTKAEITAMDSGENPVYLTITTDIANTVVAGTAGTAGEFAFTSGYGWDVPAHREFNFEASKIKLWLPKTATGDALAIKYKVGTGAEQTLNIKYKYAPEAGDDVKLTYNKDGINLGGGVTVSYSKDDSKEMGKLTMSAAKQSIDTVVDGEDVLVNVDDDALFKKLPADIKAQFEDVKSKNVVVYNITVDDGTYHVFNTPSTVTVELIVPFDNAKVYHVDPDNGYKVEKVAVKTSKQLKDETNYKITFATKRFSPFIITTADLDGVSKITEPAGATEAGTQSAAATSSAASSNAGTSTNPDTGIALAIAPVVLAAGAVAVVALKKKH